MNIDTKLVRATLVVAIGWIAVKYAPIFSFIAFATFVAYGSFRAFIYRARRAKWVSKWDVVRFIRGARKSFGASPVALALYAACSGMAAILVSLFLLTHSSSVGLIGGFFVGTTLFIATLFDWYARLKYLSSIPVFRKIASLIIWFMGTATVFLSTVIAKQLAHSISQADPSSMPEFVHLASAFVFPFAISFVLSIALTVVMTVQYLALLIGLVVTFPVKNALVYSSTSRRTKLENILYRVLNGRKPPKSLPWWESVVDGVQYFLRPIGTGAIAGAVLIIGMAVFSLGEKTPEKYIQILLIMTEYRNPHLCENISHLAHISYLQGGYVSVALMNGDKYSFSIEKCHK